MPSREAHLVKIEAIPGASVTPTICGEPGSVNKYEVLRHWGPYLTNILQNPLRRDFARARIAMREVKDQMTVSFSVPPSGALTSDAHIHPPPPLASLLYMCLLLSMVSNPSQKRSKT